MTTPSRAFVLGKESDWIRVAARTLQRHTKTSPNTIEEELMKHAIDMPYGIWYVNIMTSGSEDIYLEVGIVWPGMEEPVKLVVEEADAVSDILGIAEEDFKLGEVPYGIALQVGVYNSVYVQEDIHNLKPLISIG
jgi:hypothetical protein